MKFRYAIVLGLSAFTCGCGPEAITPPAGPVLTEEQLNPLSTEGEIFTRPMPSADGATSEPEPPK